MRNEYISFDLSLVTVIPSSISPGLPQLTKQCFILPCEDKRDLHFHNRRKCKVIDLEQKLNPQHIRFLMLFPSSCETCNTKNFTIK
uniref:Uncharacterized protein n=1 Tax=Anguilla anguilla TaxID=7936 RepID=A0A0E9WJC7_ANGAN